MCKLKKTFEPLHRKRGSVGKMETEPNQTVFVHS